jgi:hypothetical protein
LLTLELFNELGFGKSKRRRVEEEDKISTLQFHQTSERERNERGKERESKRM